MDRGRLIEGFQTQMAALNASARAYDAGDLWEADRLSVVVFNLVHDSPRSKGEPIMSILSQLGIREKLEYLSTAKVREPAETPRTGLAGFKGGSTGWSYSPHCESIQITPWDHLLPFEDWWTGEIVYLAPGGSKLKRYDIAKVFRNQHGSHWAKTIKGEGFRELATNADPRTTQGPPNGPQSPIKEAHRASMRQIAYDLTKTLKQIDLSSL